MKLLIVVDMQKDFIDGALGSPEAQAIVPNVKKMIEEYQAAGEDVIFTLDTHDEKYMETQEGKNLPVPHCIKGTDGWQIIDDLAAFVGEENTLDKSTFGSQALPGWISEKLGGVPLEIELCGVCTDICVISNAMILKAAYPETVVTIEGACCAGVSPESHRTALQAMQACQILVK